MAMSTVRFVLASVLIASSALPIVTGAQAPAQGGRGAAPAPPAPGTAAAQPGGGRGRGAIPVMTLTSSAWPDGGQVPVKFTQAGDESSPPLTWSNVPSGAASFVLIVHDLDAATGNGADDILHWMLWNIPLATTSLGERLPSTAQLPDGTRQIGATGPGYRGPGAPAAGPAHHYVFELYALDIVLDIPAVGASPAQTRAAVLAAMAGHVRGKGSFIGLFKRP